MKQAILLVAFGTSKVEARGAFSNIAKLTAARFPQATVRWAFTSEFIRRKLARQGEQLDSPLLALARLHDEGFTHVVVQSLHTIAGAEYDELRATVDMFRQGPNAFVRLGLGQPLLASHADAQRAMQAVLAAVPATRHPSDAVVLVGHGNAHHAADLAYVAAAAVLRELDPLAFLGTVAGHPTRDDVVVACRQAKVKKAYLLPFMSVAGDHAQNDMAGDGPESWKSVLSAAGIDCIPVMLGTAQIDAVVAIWLDHLANAATDQF